MKVNTKPETGYLELISFFIPKEEFSTELIKIYRVINSQEIRYVLHEYTLYILLYIDEIDPFYFFSYQVHTHTINEENKSTNIGYAPSLSLIGDLYIVAIGGLDSDTVNLFDLETGEWIFVGKMQSTRYGAYSLYDEENMVIYICGGKDNEHQDNSLEIEYFSIRNVGNKFEIKTIELEMEFLLRRSFPVSFQCHDSSTFIVCGGNGLIDEDTSTTTFVFISKAICELHTDLHKEFSSKNPNIAITSKFAYFFYNDTEVIKFDASSIKFTSIYKIDNEDNEEEKKKSFI